MITGHSKLTTTTLFLSLALFTAQYAQAKVAVCAYLGDNGSKQWSFSDFKKDLGNRNAAIYHRFMQLSRDGFKGNDPDNFLNDVKQHASGAEVMLTLELTLKDSTSMSDLGEKAYKQIAQRMKAWNDKGITIHARILHEANGRNSDGSTYFRQQVDPKTYVRVFRGIASAIHAATSTKVRRVKGKVIGATLTMWSVMLQHRDSKTDVNDFFPGKDAVDEVGITLISQVPVKLPPRKDGKPNAKPASVADKLNYSGRDGKRQSFYERYCKQMGLPLYITETARPTPFGMDRQAEVNTKWDWFDQVYNEQLMRQFPRLQGICYLEMDRSGYGKMMHYGVFGREKSLSSRARGRLSQLLSKKLVRFS